jgi:hypothetical protein
MLTTRLVAAWRARELYIHQNAWGSASASSAR